MAKYTSLQSWCDCLAGNEKISKHKTGHWREPSRLHNLRSGIGLLFFWSLFSGWIDGRSAVLKSNQGLDSGPLTEILWLPAPKWVSPIQRSSKRARTYKVCRRLPGLASRCSGWCRPGPSKSDPDSGRCGWNTPTCCKSNGDTLYCLFVVPLLSVGVVTGLIRTPPRRVFQVDVGDSRRLIPWTTWFLLSLPARTALFARIVEGLNRREACWSVSQILCVNQSNRHGKWPKITKPWVFCGTPECFWAALVLTNFIFSFFPTNSGTPVKETHARPVSLCWDFSVRAPIYTHVEFTRVREANP